MQAAKDHRRARGRGAGRRDHPVVGWVGLLAIVATIVLLVWVRVTVIGTRDIEAALVEPAATEGAARHAAEGQSAQQRDVDEAVAASRWATGLSP